MEKLSRATTALLIAITIIVLAPLSASAVEYGDIGGRPASIDTHNDRTKSIFIFNLEAGKTAQNGVEVANNGPARKDIAIYAVDAQHASGGNLACAQKVEVRQEVGSWINLEKTTVTLDPHAKEVIPFHLSIPHGVEPGEHNGCIIIQDTSQTPQANSNSGVNLSFRSAIRVAVTVQGDVKKDLAIESVKIKDVDDKLLIHTVLRNSGNVSLDTDVSGSIKSLIGTTVHSSDSAFVVLAENTQESNIEAERFFWGGWYILDVTATYNSDPHSGLGEVGTRSSTSTRQIIFIWPQPLALGIELIGLLVLLSGGYYIFTIVRARRHWKNNTTPYTVQDGDTLQSIADKHGLPWRLIANINHIRKPYSLPTDHTLQIPQNPKTTPNGQATRK